MKPTHLYGPGPVYDIIFGHPVHHFYVLMVLLITLIAWAWLVLRRNLKRDASVQQIFSPLQALLFCIYFDSIVLAFYSWRNGPAWEHHYVLLTAVMAPVGVLTLSLLRNREELRIHMASSGDAQPNHLLEATWPASFVLLGLLPAGTLVLMLAEQLGRIDTLPGNLAWGLLKLLMLAFWLMRDVAYLQWSALRRGRHSLLMGVIYLLVFYLASLIFVSVAFDGKGYQFHIFSAILGPISLAYRDTTLPPDAPWFFSLLVQVVLLGLFCFLQGGAIREIFSGLSSVLEPAASSDTKGQ